MSDQQQTSNRLGTALLCASLVAIFVGERVFGAGPIRTASSALGAALFLIAFGVRARALVRARGDVRAVEGRLLGAYAGVAVALLLYALSTDASLDVLGLSEQARTRASGALSTLWLAAMVVSLSALLFMELVYARMPVAASVELRRVRTAAYAGLTLALSLVFVLSLNYVVTARDVRRDVSYFKTTEPSPSTQRMLRKLKTPVQALLFYRRTDDVLTQLEPYFAALTKHSPSFRYQVLDAALAPELTRKHRVNGNGSVLLLRGQGDEQKAQPMRVGKELTEARPQLRKLDSLFQTNFAKLVQPERSVQLTVGHGEHGSKAGEQVERGDGTEVLAEVWTRLNLKTSKIGMAQGLANAVPDGASAVVIMGPREKFLPEEAEALLGHVRKGGRLLLLVEPGGDDGLEPLLAGLGLTRLPGRLASTKAHIRRRYDESDHGIVFSNRYSAHPSVTTATRYASEMASILVGGVALEKRPGAQLVTPPKPRTITFPPEPDAGPEPSEAATAPGADAEAGPKPAVTFPLRSPMNFFRDLDGDFVRDEGEPEETLNLIAAVTLSDKPGAPEGRAVVIGDGDFMTDKVAANNGNLTVFVDALAWLIGDEELNAEVSSEEDVPLEHTRDRDKLWFYATTFAMPLPLLGLGVWVARRRRRAAEARA